MNIAPVLASLLLFNTQKEPKGGRNVEDVSFVTAILIGIWVFLVTARIQRKNNRSPAEPLLPNAGPTDVRSSDIDKWSFEPESSDRSAIEQGDHWLLG